MHGFHAKGVKGLVNKEKLILHEEESLDDLILGDLQVIQSTQGYRFSLDAVLLAHFPEASPKQVVELGAGSGVVSLIMAWRAPGAKFSLIEIQPAMVERARRSIALNGLEARIKVIEGDIREIEKILPAGYADLVISNPPFWKKGEGKVSSKTEEAIARHELNLNLEELVQKGAYLLRQGGKMDIIHRAERLDEAMEIFRRYKMPVRKLRLIHSFIDREARLVLIEAQKNRPGPLLVLPPMIIYEKVGEYGAELRQIYNR